MAGRKKEPTDLIVYKGKKHLTKDEIEERKANEIKAPADQIRAPSYLTKRQAEEFYELAEQLLRIKIFSNLDCDSLASFVLAREMYVKITKNLLKMKPVILVTEIVKDKNGEPKQKKDYLDNEAYAKTLASQDRLFKQCRAAASDLGLSISSRCRLVIPKMENEEKPKSKWGEFI